MMVTVRVMGAAVLFLSCWGDLETKAGNVHRIVSFQAGCQLRLEQSSEPQKILLFSKEDIDPGDSGN
ncbi:hypothetical protein BO99DRAFT_406739 [Aspergillus violaceofuscus CBS 115571]|uniref:Uncharacterized protein n=1 Tax=Aspergillus violaceofuscus (strain CBS 115571) TaxID=1450538 RepID=A0A2V5HEK6_ASPV1|nr:hypothetical protein BO99DRAFT_406739 [Aspergillus violaceofuscus CBS 115571]